MTHRYAAVHPCVPAVEHGAVQVMTVQAADMYEESFPVDVVCEALCDDLRSLSQELRVFSMSLTVSDLESLQGDMLAASKSTEIVWLRPTIFGPQAK